jgi:glycosyl transferase family 2
VRLAMTILVRDAEDLIETNLRYHRAQGVDLFLIGDNGSTDRTLDILKPYCEAGLVELDHIEGDPRHAWSAGRTMLARKAHELGADWVIHDDHDEFWWPLTGTLKEALGAIPERFGLVSAPRTEFVARRGEKFWTERLTVREARFRRPPKIAHRTHPQVRIRQPHPVDIWIDHGTSPRHGLVGRPVRRASEAHSEETELELLLAPDFSIGVLHFPVRSLKQYTRLVGIAVATSHMGRRDETRRIRDAYKAGRLEDIYREMAFEGDEIKSGIEAGHLAEDTGFRDYLRACPDPLSGEEGPGPLADVLGWSQERRERELAELEADSMYTLSRYLQTIAYRRLSDRQLRSAARGAQERLQEIEATTWWRMRPRYRPFTNPLRRAWKRWRRRSPAGNGTSAGEGTTP